MKTVLLTNGQQRKTLAAVRSLGKRGINVIVAEETRFNISAFSRYCNKSLVCPSAKKSPEKYYKWLIDTIEKYKCDVIFPMDDDVLEVMMKHHEELQSKCSIILPGIESYERASDKGRAVQRAVEAGVACPETLFPEGVEGLKAASGKLKYPVVIKPRKSSGSRGIRMAGSEKELLSLYEEAHKVQENPIIQEYIGLGDRYDVCLLYDRNHELKAHFIQKEIRHFPVDIGPSTVQMSVESPELLDMAVKIMKKLPWYGVVELEFMVDRRDNKFKFMEINPRFWGSLKMAVIAGIDFPWLLYKLSVGDTLEETEKYETGCMCRWLLPGDIFHFITNRERKKMNPPFIAGRKYNLQDDFIDRDDPLPVLGFILACVRYAFDIEMWKFIFKR